jgi:hypothetical protein
MKKIVMGQLLSIVANLGVIAGIVFLAFELRQNTEAVQAESFQSYTDSSISFLSQIAQNAEFAEIAYASLYNTRPLNEVEEYRLRLNLRTQWYRFQNAYSQWNRGALAVEDWEVARKLMCIQASGAEGDSMGASQLRRDTWVSHTPYLNQSFIKFIEGPDCWALTSVGEG